jgi:phage terminase large subunit-like protein
MLERTDNAERFAAKVKVRLAAAQERLGNDPGRARRFVTANDPMAFAFVYLMRHLAEGVGFPSLSEVHWAWAEEAETWTSGPLKRPASYRRAEIAPRGQGKSTWWFLILPMWAAAHGHVTFCAAFANTPTQAETHLATFKSELDNNELLRQDYPLLVKPKTRGRGTTEADRVSLYHSESGFVFGASGMDSSNLGLKVGATRPDLIICDDLEPHEANYSLTLAEKRLGTLLDAILPLNVFARVVLVGTVTMSDSIMHQLVKAAHGVETAQWITDQHFRPRHYEAILPNDDGSRRSVWPEKWPLEWLESIEHTREYAKNYANDPIGADGPYWQMETFKRGKVEGVTRRLLSVDPNVTQTKQSDFTGLAIIAWSPSLNRCVVEFASQVKMQPKALRLLTLQLIEQYRVGLLLVEVNQGGDLWRNVFHDMPLKIRTLHQDEKKELRAARALNFYERGQVVHDSDAKLGLAEAQMVGFPKAPHDDMVDAIGSGVNYFLYRGRASARAASSTTVYV